MQRELGISKPGERMLAEVKLVVAISSRALFDLDESHQVFEAKGEEEYSRYQISQESVPLLPGVAFSMVRKLLALNTDPSHPRVEVVLSRGTAPIRVFAYSIRSAITNWISPELPLHGGNRPIDTLLPSEPICSCLQIRRMFGEHWMRESPRRQSCLREVKNFARAN
jgi:hypothetical protein